LVFCFIFHCFSEEISSDVSDESVEVIDTHVQTDISQFQIDEIVLRLAALQASRNLQNDDDSDNAESSLLCIGRKSKKRNHLESVGDKSVAEMTDKEILTTMLQVMTQSMETDPIPQKAMKDHGVNTQPQVYISCGVSTQPVSYRTQSVETDTNDVINRSVETDDAMLIDQSMETSRSECVDAENDAASDMSWAERVRRDMMTSPILRRLLFKTINASSHSGSAEDAHSNTDHSQQTSIIIEPTRSTVDQEQQMSLHSDIDHSQQTSMIIDHRVSGIDQQQQTSLSIDRPPLGTDQWQQTSCSIDRPPRLLDDAATQSSPDVIDKMTAPMMALPLNRLLQTSQDEMMSRSQQTSEELLNVLMDSRQLVVVSTGVGPDEGMWDYSVTETTSHATLPEAESYHSCTDWNLLGTSSFCDARMADSIEMSTQCSPPLSRSVTTQNSKNLGVTNTRARSSSTSGLGTSIFDDETRQEVIIQTDDSYLKIARRLDEYRSNRTQFLPVVAASPLESRDIEPFKTDRPSERRGFYVDIKGLQRRNSIKPKRRMSHKLR
ncbi:hypothetical protein COOONC_19521, partial [Cooperia oncophora]